MNNRYPFSTFSTHLNVGIIEMSITTYKCEFCTTCIYHKWPQIQLFLPWAPTINSVRALWRSSHKPVWALFHTWIYILISDCKSCHQTQKYFVKVPEIWAIAFVSGNNTGLAISEVIVYGFGMLRHVSQNGSFFGVFPTWPGSWGLESELVLKFLWFCYNRYWNWLKI